MAFVLALAVFLALWNNVANLLPAFEAWYVPINLALALVLVAAARARGASWDDIGLDPMRIRPGLVWGAAAFAVVAAGLALAWAVPPVRPLFDDARVAGLDASGLAFLALVRIPLGTVLLEEVAFRGVLLGTWARERSQRTALLGQAAVFGLWHITPTWIALSANAVALSPESRVGAILGGVILTAVAGVLFGWLRIRSGSVVAPVLAHIGTNSLAALVAASAM